RSPRRSKLSAYTRAAPPYRRDLPESRRPLRVGSRPHRARPTGAAPWERVRRMAAPRQSVRRALAPALGLASQPRLEEVAAQRRWQSRPWQLPDPPVRLLQLVRSAPRQPRTMLLLGHPAPRRPPPAQVVVAAA